MNNDEDVGKRCRMYKAIHVNENISIRASYLKFVASYINNLQKQNSRATYINVLTCYHLNVLHISVKLSKIRKLSNLTERVDYKSIYKIKFPQSVKNFCE